MTRNIYALLNDHSAEADKFIEDWNKSRNYHDKRTPRERLAKMANTLKGEEIVKDYLNEHDLINCWEFTDPDREVVITDKNENHLCWQADLKHAITGTTCEVKEFEDSWFPEFGEGYFVFVYKSKNKNADAKQKAIECWRYYLHKADYCVAINESHNKLAWLDLNTLSYWKDNKFLVKAFNVIKLGGNQ